MPRFVGLRRLGRWAPPQLKAVVSRALALLLRGRDSLLDVWDVVVGRRGELVPPRRLAFVGGDFEKTGEEFLRLFVELADLRPNEQVLDVGCGIGRMAVPLTRYLDSSGRYEGFDIVPVGIEWCQARITPRFPNFRFALANINNLTYNPSGRYQAAEYRFAYDDSSFDFVFFTSVFTHLMPPDMRRYISEGARVLRPGGRLFATFLLLNDESLRLMNEGTSRFNFRHDLGECRTTDPREPTAAVAYPETLVQQYLAENGLTPRGPTRYGSWCGRSHFLSLQDLLVMTKTT